MVACKIKQGEIRLRTKKDSVSLPPDRGHPFVIAVVHDSPLLSSPVNTKNLDRLLTLEKQLIKLITYTSTPSTTAAIQAQASRQPVAIANKLVSIPGKNGVIFRLKRSQTKISTLASPSKERPKVYDPVQAPPQRAPPSTSSAAPVVGALSPVAKSTRGESEIHCR